MKPLFQLGFAKISEAAGTLISGNAFKRKSYPARAHAVEGFDP